MSTSVILGFLTLTFLEVILGIDNVMALRGDAMKEEKYFMPKNGGNNYAVDLVKQIKQLKSVDDALVVPKVYKDEDDKDFVKNVFRKTVLNEVELSKEYIDKTPNWDVERIAEIDTIILKMAICELLKFPSIPAKVTINEYLEIAKEYSTPKSSIFINGILDNLVKEFEKDKRLTKSGRGLL